MDSVRVAEVELSRFKNSLEALGAYKEAKALLSKCGIVNLLRIFARPFTSDRGANPYTAAYTAAFCEGYNKCLDDIMYFDEQYLNEVRNRKPVRADFGGLSLALSKGDLTEKDIRNGK